MGNGTIELLASWISTANSLVYVLCFSATLNRFLEVLVSPHTTFVHR
jgi:hypothetical protein